MSNNGYTASLSWVLTARNLQKLALLAVGEDGMLLDRGALAGGDSTAGETAPAEGRTKPRTGVNGQLRLAM